MSSASQLAQKAKRRNATLSCAECRRFVLANTEVLHDKITILANRVRALEDALQDVQSSVSSQPHPLLTDELRALKKPLEREAPEEQAQEQEQESVESINVGSLYTPIPEAEFDEAIFARVYDSMDTERAPMDAHQLAVLCFVLALGTLLDLEKPSLSAEAMRYYQLGRAALSVDSVLESQSIPAIQAVVSCLALASPA
ncbi:hypothetical protein TRAPUB_13889 [Trametes pubescens]|uniref:Uncharacterized protein n=1 Tax=Trametes pubescens TaxID=154538 RepID=A0A1M2VPZ6_TRAPU|nr:hypothetical protein TRAPUB_13889 [Trametes pubescens]